MCGQRARACRPADASAREVPTASVSASGGGASELEFRKLLSVQGIPAYYFFDTSGRVVGVLDSEMELLTFQRMLVFIRDGHFFRTPWERFVDMPEASEDAIDDLF